MNGIDAGDGSGFSVSSAGNVNGDGYDDLIIGSRGEGGFGETYIIYGGATGTESLTPVTAQGTAAADNFTGNAGVDSVEVFDLSGTGANSLVLDALAVFDVT